MKMRKRHFLFGVVALMALSLGVAFFVNIPRGPEHRGNTLLRDEHGSVRLYAA